MTATAYADGQAIEMRSDSINESPWHYLEAEGELVTREELKKGEGYHPLLTDRRDSLLKKMDENNCDRIFQIPVHWSENGDILLEPEDVVVKPEQVQMVDTEIPWPTN